MSPAARSYSSPICIGLVVVPLGKDSRHDGSFSMIQAPPALKSSRIPVIQTTSYPAAEPQDLDQNPLATFA